MNPEKFALAVGTAVFVGGSAGLILHRVLPEKHLTGGGKDMVGAVVGLLTLLSALCPRPPHLDRLWRVWRPECCDSDPRRQSPATR